MPFSMSIYSLHPITLGAVHTYPLASRKSKVSIRDFAKPPAANASLTKFFDSLPNILAAEDLRRLLSAIHIARKQRKAILWGIGGRSEERRVGKECRSRWSQDHWKTKSGYSGLEWTW